jgi:glycosyltransferase involved in cell wall biosynthesis
VRVCICDYSGHPFQVQLSREIARRGHHVLHLYFAEFQTPKGRLSRTSDDAPEFAVEAISLGRPFAKYDLIRRRNQELEIGKRFAQRIRSYGPDVVLGCNFPLDTLQAVVKSCRSEGRQFVFWQQDIYSVAITEILGAKYGLVGRLVGQHYRRKESRAAMLSSAIVVITSDFASTLEKHFGISPEKIHVVENWAPLDEILPRPKSNEWSIAQGLSDHTVVLYTGTLGMKHDAGKLLALAEALRERPNTLLVVASEGPSAAWLAARAAELELTTLRVIPFQPFEVYSEVLSAADVLVSTLGADAGKYSVPSKILSYLCAGRPIVLSAPEENLAYRIVRHSGAGAVVPASDTIAFITAVERLLDDADARSLCARSARAYAEKNFDIERIGDRFEAILSRAGPHLEPKPGLGSSILRDGLGLQALLRRQKNADINPV